jgi:hypothetical protein
MNVVDWVSVAASLDNQSKKIYANIIKLYIGYNAFKRMLSQ